MREEVKILSPKVAVVIPAYKDKLNDFEKISLAQCREVLGKYPLVFVTPEEKNFSYFQQGDMVAAFPQKYFQSIKDYNVLMLSPEFYETFLDFDYILIYQLDAFVFYDALEYFCSLGYDYIGAPVAYHSWYGLTKDSKTPRVGNGGFSLRKVKACHQLLTEVANFPGWNYVLDNFFEDGFFGYCGADSGINFHAAPIKVAVCFAVDFFPDRFLRRIGNKIPFGCHGWPKYSADAYLKIFRRAGYDLSPLRDKMDNKDYQIPLENGLETVAQRRLLRDMHKRFISQYLPTKNFASIRVMCAPESMKVLEQLNADKNFQADETFLYEERHWEDLLAEIKPEKLPHLLLTLKYDKSLIAAIEEQGLSYGKHFVSFWQEYLKFCKKLFHGLGKNND